MCDKVNLLTKDIDKKILKEINLITEGFLKKNNLIKTKLISEYENSFKIGYQSIMSKKVLYYYKYVREEREKYGKYYVIDQMGISKVILDCEKLSHGKEFWKLEDIEFSNDESFLVFSVDTKGGGLCDIYLKSYFEDNLDLLVNNKEDKISGDLQISYNR